MAIGQRTDGNAVRSYYDGYWSAPEQPRYEIGPVLGDLIERNVDDRTRCLDVGCGAGQTYAQTVSRRAASYTGVDVSAAAVALARTAGLDAHVVEDAARLPFPDNSFDLAICVEVFEHLFSPDGSAREIWRVLRPGGKLVASTPNAVYWRLRINLLFGRWNPLGDALSIEQPWRDPHIRFFTPDTMRRMLLGAGFRSAEVGAHAGRFLDHLTSRPTDFGVSRAYRSAEVKFPSLLGLTIHTLAVK
jgi:SAM-dependent methyltransferase